jgi:hypothetical protein
MPIAYYDASISDFLDETPESILGKLTLHHRHELEHQQRNAWLTQIEVLKDQLADFPTGQLFFEFFIPRMGSVRLIRSASSAAALSV